MAAKRKSTSGTTGTAPQKRTRTEPEAHLGWLSDDSEEYQVNYTDNGTLRADSEARRQWHYVCTVQGCEQRFNRPCRLEAHMRSHNKERPFACFEPGCDKTFPRKDHLQRHLKNAHNDPATERTFTCSWEGCGKSFTSNGRLQRHREVHESKFYCIGYPPCKEVFRKEKSLEAHVKSQHLEVKPYPCTHVNEATGDRCMNGYQSEGALQRHVYKVHVVGNNNGLYCMICTEADDAMEVFDSETGDMVVVPTEPLAFANHEELMEHTRTWHPPKCTECGQRFKSDANLKSHFDTVHGDPSQQPRYPCPNLGCESVFNRKHNLAVHIETVHDKQCKYICAPDAFTNSKHEDLKAWNGENACGIAFKAKSSLDEHVRTHHLGLGNRKELRKAAKPKKNPEPSMLSMLTGVGYEKNRDVICLVPNCEFRFYMDRDLRRHLRATHIIPDDEIEDMIRERDALAGGEFWIGGLDDPMSVFDSVTPSMPQTPAPYFAEQSATLQDGQAKSVTDPQMGFFEQQYDIDMMDEEAEMDIAMGLSNLAPAKDVQEELQWDMLVAVEQFNMGDEY
ncbi:zinc finger protein 585A [Phaeosphaeriaceae sp. PMI808]|nr:zinc finger protein 585A [Phaeosphaeriaceae sp. PMI808]